MDLIEKEIKERQKAEERRQIRSKRKKKYPDFDLEDKYKTRYSKKRDKKKWEKILTRDMICY